MGGLYWCFPLEDAGDASDQLVWKTMKHCPFSQLVTQVVTKASRQEFLIDDQLSLAAAFILSGVYIVDTSIQNQVEHVSWWPKEDTWYQSKLNVGYWSEACESWYQNRLTDICKGTAWMLNATAWRDMIKGKGAHVMVFKAKFNQFAQEFIEKNGKPLVLNRG
ncbi:uncharacterized protein LACBIDRAFT_331940 [Laccaria bicolor S238N-H82]|uniref:Predicted protein n=1 Tax=Laccaria bicolor (strain S238N-H82 / ATCC MYA-4686) TaxID=486041 RepID=B0DR39_LACBS|nr:uncharacterized protein LACBIDRAFT_331940 [Laccaria bicolor S238N-H82]EDR02931.1 predicted protein [Laccaria bicolor S238N-H82]|eukprot:XP_001886354.1 predicted protein [Laccaria bicolor S238N-H82]